MLLPLFHKLGETSISGSLCPSFETVSPSRDGDRLRTFIQEAGLSLMQFYRNLAIFGASTPSTAAHKATGFLRGLYEGLGQGRNLGW